MSLVINTHIASIVSLEVSFSSDLSFCENAAGAEHGPC